MYLYVYHSQPVRPSFSLPKINHQDLPGGLFWQGFQFVKITFPELEKVDIQEILDVLDG